MSRVPNSLRRTVGGFAAAVVVLTMAIAGDVKADPESDAMDKLNELSRQAVQSREGVTSAQRDLEDKLAVQTAAEERHRADLAALDAANSQLASRQAAADNIAAMTYVSGRTGQMAALLTASSPQQLIDQLSLQQGIAAEAGAQLKAFHAAREQAVAAAKASEASAAEARAAAEKSAEVRSGLQSSSTDLQRRIAAAEAQYAALTPAQQAVVDNAPPPPAAVPPPADPMLNAMPAPPPAAAAPLPAAIPDNPDALPVGVAYEAGLQPNTILAARAVSQRFPQIAEIGGVRPDSKPWHPSGLAIDIMIPNAESPEGIALGDEIMAFAMANAARFGLQDVIWRGTYYTPSGPAGSGYGHFDHVHITTTPRR
ncbi:glycoside hydrolase [Mycobacterium sp. NPDC051804]|uniref:glycoside hydrolase n=1 Tax=Mycobacterium sp. NPDC051804 TaxID=3364295 RepID=UPI0037A2A130